MTTNGDGRRLTAVPRISRDELAQLRNERNAISIRSRELHRQINTKVAELEWLQRRLIDIEKVLGD